MAGRGAAVCVALLRQAAGEQGGVGWFADDNFRLRALLGQHARDALEGSASPKAGDPVIQLFALEIVHDLARRRARVHVGIRLVLELADVEPAMLLRQFLRLHDHAGGAQRGGRQDHLRAEEAHQSAALNREALGHGDHQRVALGGADHREADAGIAAGRLDHRHARFQLAGFFRRLDDAERQPVLDRSKRIEGLNLDPEIHMLWRKFVDPDHGRVANGSEDVLIAHAVFL